MPMQILVCEGKLSEGGGVCINGKRGVGMSNV
jgi:hypothetical protein